MCKCLSEEFIRTKSSCNCCQICKLKADVIVTDKDDDEEDEEDEQKSERVDYGDKRVSIRGCSRRKGNRVQLCCYVDELKDGILPYLEQIFRRFLRSSYFRKGVARPPWRPFRIFSDLVRSP